MFTITITIIIIIIIIITRIIMIRVAPLAVQWLWLGISRLPPQAILPRNSFKTFHQQDELFGRLFLRLVFSRLLFGSFVYLELTRDKPHQKLFLQHLEMHLC